MSNGKVCIELPAAILQNLSIVQRRWRDGKLHIVGLDGAVEGPSVAVASGSEAGIDELVRYIEGGVATAKPGAKTEGKESKKKSAIASKPASLLSPATGVAKPSNDNDKCGAKAPTPLSGAQLCLLY